MWHNSRILRAKNNLCHRTLSQHAWLIQRCECNKTARFLSDFGGRGMLKFKAIPIALSRRCGRINVVFLVANAICARMEMSAYGSETKCAMLLNGYQ